MDLLERFRHKSPRWEDPDPTVRAEGVREEIHLDDQALLSRIASGDPDARVRRAAVRKLTSVEALAASASDADEGVREIVSEALVSLALGSDAAASVTAVAALGEARHLLTVARSAPLPEARLAALARIGDGRQLATLAKTAGDPSVRAEALRRIEDGVLLADIAAKTDHKGTAVAAVEKIEDIEALRAIASRAVHKAASRRAQAKLDALAPPPSPVEPVAEPVVEMVSEEVAPHEPAPDATGVDPVHEATAEAPAAAASDPEPASAETPAVVGSDADVAAPSPEPPPSAFPGVAEASAVQDVASARDVPAAAAPASSRDGQERARRERVEHAEALCSRLETLTRSSNVELRDAEAALREARALHDQGGLPGKLEHRLKTTRAALFARAQELREADEWSRWANAAIQEELCAKLEGLAGRDDLEQVAKELHEADARWAAARHAPRDKAEALRQRYQAVRAALRSRLDAFFARRAEEQAERLKGKQALCERAEALADSTDWLKTSDEIKGLQARWKEIGPAAPRDERLAWKRFHAACDRFFTRRQEDLKHRKDQWSANLQRKDALCVKAEALAESSDWEKAAAEVRRLQAEWKTVGPVRRSQSEAIWLRFRKACDAFFERYKKREEIEAESKRGEREAVCRDMEEMGLEGAEVPADLAARVVGIMARARQAPTRLIAAYPAAFKGTDLDPEANRQRRERLCARVEALAAEGSDEPLVGEALARRLKEALAANTIAGHQEVEARRRAERAEVESAQAAWKRLGPVPGDVGVSLEARFDAACARFFGAHRGAGRALSVR
jgi:hypothetical protein